jgi:hypothetical protein
LFLCLLTFANSSSIQAYFIAHSAVKYLKMKMEPDSYPLLYSNDGLHVIKNPAGVPCG